MTVEQGKQVQILDENGLEVSEMSASPVLDELIRPLRTAMLPIHEDMLMTVASPAEREALADVYSQDARPLKEFANMTLDVFGMIIMEVPGGWTGKDGVYHREGYYQARMVCSDPNNTGSFILVKSSGIGLLKHVYHIVGNRGWYRFTEGPLQYKVTVGTNNAHIIHNVSNNPFAAPKGAKK